MGSDSEQCASVREGCWGCAPHMREPGQLGSALANYIGLNTAMLPSCLHVVLAETLTLMTSRT